MSPLLLQKDAIRTREAVEKLTFSGKTGLCKGQRLTSDRSGRDHSEQAESAHLQSRQSYILSLRALNEILSLHKKVQLQH